MFCSPNFHRSCKFYIVKEIVLPHRKLMRGKKLRYLSMVLFVCALVALLRSIAGTTGDAGIQREERAVRENYVAEESHQSPWRYKCVSERCVKDYSKDSSTVPLETCKLTCGGNRQLWPMPNTKSVRLSKVTQPFLLSGFEVLLDNPPSAAVGELLVDAGNRVKKMLLQLYLKNLTNSDSVHPFLRIPEGDKYNRVVVKVKVQQGDVVLTHSTDESYSISASKGQNFIEVVIAAKTFFGARHGMETLLQCISFDEVHESLQIIESLRIINDHPEYPHRGLTLDSSRGFTPIDVVKRIIDGMAINKLNMLHWHLSDSQSFPLQVKRQPLVGKYGAYSPADVYTMEDVEELVKYARIRGVKIIPELDAPAHVGSGWQWGESAGLGKLVLCFNKQPWQKFCFEPPCGQLNPLNIHTYSVLQDIYRDLNDVFDGDLFHMGGDELTVGCWNTTDGESDGILEYIKQRNWSRNEINSFIKVWGDVFQRRAFTLLREVNSEVTAIMWTSALTNPLIIANYLPKENYIIQIWSSKNSSAISQLAELGYRLIFSNSDALYLDCGFSAWVGPGPNNGCSPYKSWQQVYDNRLDDIVFEQLRKQGMYKQKKDFRKLILGGETAMWSEQSDGYNLESKIWPRTAAHAERLWTNPITNYSAAEMRLVQHRYRMGLFGIPSEVVQPEWCRQNEGSCDFIEDFYMKLNEEDLPVHNS